MRLFLAVNLPEDIRSYLFSLQNHFSGNIKFVKKENIHITLLFLGEVESLDFVDRLGFDFKAFDAKLEEIDYFPY